MNYSEKNEKELKLFPRVFILGMILAGIFILILGVFFDKFIEGVVVLSSFFMLAIVWNTEGRLANNPHLVVSLGAVLAGCFFVGAKLNGFYFSEYTVYVPVFLSFLSMLFTAKERMDELRYNSLLIYAQAKLDGLNNKNNIT